LILAVVLVLLGSVATELRWGGCQFYVYASWVSCNGETMVKTAVLLPKLSKKISQGCHLFWTTLYIYTVFRKKMPLIFCC